jgi:glc operon protein GlcG
MMASSLWQGSHRAEAPAIARASLLRCRKSDYSLSLGWLDWLATYAIGLATEALLLREVYMRKELLFLGVGLLMGAAVTGHLEFGADAAEQQPRPPTFNFSGPVPAQFVISPEDGARIHDHISIAAEVAERLSHICQANAKMHGGSATVVILDPYGRIVHEHRMDGQSYINQKAAENKAMTALLTREPSHVLTNRAFEDVHTLVRMDQFGLTVQEGGLPIVVNDQLIGAIGVGGGAGGASYGEERCAHDALTEVFGEQPPILPPPAGARSTGGGIPQRTGGNG